MNVYREQKYIQDRQLLWFARFYSCRRCNEKSYADCSLALPTSTRTGNRRTISVSVSVIILLIVIVERNDFVYCQSQYFQSKIKYMWQFHCFSPSISLKCQKRPKVFKHKFIYRENKEIQGGPKKKCDLKKGHNSSEIHHKGKKLVCFGKFSINAAR